MKFLCKIIFLVMFSSAVYLNPTSVGLASWYGEAFHGKTTANGEKFNMMALTAAHKSLPFNTVVRVTNLLNNRSVVVRINDRGPFRKDRIIDLSKYAAQKLDFLGIGVAPVKIEVIESVVGKKKSSIADGSKGKILETSKNEIEEQGEHLSKDVISDKDVNKENEASNSLIDSLTLIKKESDFYIQVGSYIKKDYANRAYKMLKKVGLPVVVNFHEPFYTVFIPTDADDIQKNVKLIKSIGYKDALVRKTKISGESLIMD